MSQQNNRYTELQAEFQRLARKDKVAHLERMCCEVENANRQGKTRDMFKKIRDISGKFAPRRNTLLSSSGQVITDGEDVKRRWSEYAKELYERDDDLILTCSRPSSPRCSLSPADAPKSLIGYDPEPDILRAEVKYALKALADNKAPGVDGLPVELFKAAGEACVDALHSLLSQIWKTGKWPHQWKQSVHIPLYKKGDPKLCSNYRTIALIPHASKIMLKVIQKRLEPIMERLIPPEQAGFRRARGTRGHISNMRRMMETSREYQKEIYMCFIDYSTAFDCVDHGTLWTVLTRLGVPAHLVSLLRGLYEDQEAAVRTEYGDSEWFGVGKGVRQGCILSPYLFNIYAEYIMREADLDQCPDGVRVAGLTLNNLKYADDTTLLSESRDGLQAMLERVRVESKKMGLSLNTKKTKIMATGEDVLPVYAGGEK